MLKLGSSLAGGAEVAGTQHWAAAGGALAVSGTGLATSVFSCSNGCDHSQTALLHMPSGQGTAGRPIC